MLNIRQANAEQVQH